MSDILVTNREIGRTYGKLDGEAARGLSTSKSSIKFQVDNENNPNSVTFSIFPRLSKEVQMNDADLGTGETVYLLREGVIVAKQGAETEDRCVVTDFSDDGIGLDKFMQSLFNGAAMQVTEGLVEAVVKPAQIRQPFYKTFTTKTGTVKRMVNVTVLKGQELSDANILGPFPFGENFVVGGNERSVEYTVMPGATVIVEIWYANFVTVAGILGRILEGNATNQ